MRWPLGTRRDVTKFAPSVRYQSAYKWDIDNDVTISLPSNLKIVENPISFAMKALILRSLDDPDQSRPKSILLCKFIS